jgi:hypothetical protein
MAKDVGMPDESTLELLEMLASEAYDDVAVTEVIRPAAILSEPMARRLMAALAEHSVLAGGAWLANTTRWDRYDRPFAGPDQPGAARLIGSLQVIYDTPRHYEITIYRAAVTTVGFDLGWTVSSLCDEAFALVGLTLATCPRASLAPPPKPFRFH